MQNITKRSQNDYIFQNNTRLYFRQSIPPDLRPIFKKTEIRISLRTPDKRLAKRKAAVLSSHIWDIMTARRKGDKRMTELSTEQIYQLVKTWVDKELADDEAGRALSVVNGKTTISNEEMIGYANEMHSTIQSDCREALATENYSYGSPGAESIIEDNDLSISPDSQEYKALCREVIKAQYELCNVMKQRNSGKYPETYTSTAVNPVLYNQNVKQSNVQKKQQNKFSTAFQEYVAEKKLKGNWTPKTVLDATAKVNIFIEIIGDIKLCDITQEKMKEAERLILKYPSSRTKKKQYKDIPYSQLKKMDIPETDRFSHKSIENYMIQVNGFLKWLKPMYEMPEWLPVIMSAPKADVTQDTTASKDIWTTEELRKIFNDPAYIQGEKTTSTSNTRKKYTGAIFWLPLMALYSGARPEELCGLYLSDFKVIDEVKCYQLTPCIEDEEGNLVKAKRIKNTASRRIVPIHDELLKLGLWEYVQELKEQGHARLFDELAASGADQRYSTGYTKWFNRYVSQTLLIKGSKQKGAKVFYSFRHTFINYCVQNSLRDIYFERVVGHAVQGNESTLKHYAKPISPRILKAEVIDRVNFDVDLSSLKNNPFSRSMKG